MDVIEMHNKGMTPTEIGIRTGDSPAVVRGYLRSQGIYFRSKPMKNSYEWLNNQRREERQVSEMQSTRVPG